MTIEKKTQLAALNAQGKSIEDISKLSGVNAADVEAFLMTRGAVPKEETAPQAEKYHKMTFKERAKIIELYDSGMKQADISRQLGIPKSTVSRVLIDAGKGRKANRTEKEPAQAATCTDSEAVIGNDNTNSLCLNDTTDRAKSQALSGISGLSCMESALDEWLGLGQEAEIVSVRADQTDSELVFEHKGEKYIMAFGRYEE